MKGPFVIDVKEPVVIDEAVVTAPPTPPGARLPRELARGQVWRHGATGRIVQLDRWCRDAIWGAWEAPTGRMLHARYLGFVVLDLNEWSFERYERIPPETLRSAGVGSHVMSRSGSDTAALYTISEFGAFDVKIRSVSGMAGTIIKVSSDSVLPGTQDVLEWAVVPEWMRPASGQRLHGVNPASTPVSVPIGRKAANPSGLRFTPGSGVSQAAVGVVAKADHDLAVREANEAKRLVDLANKRVVEMRRVVDNYTQSVERLAKIVIPGYEPLPARPSPEDLPACSALIERVIANVQKHLVSLELEGAKARIDADPSTRTTSGSA